jgi:hypothetical protein
LRFCCDIAPGTAVEDGAAAPAGAALELPLMPFGMELVVGVVRGPFGPVLALRGAAFGVDISDYAHPCKNTSSAFP